ncbi:MAG: hypothetical protein JKY27_12350, partial [Magnetovibrio sp.]|nr:hypothetical protein [Magnetovibrio sp.]
AAMEMQKRTKSHNASQPNHPLGLKIGLNAGEPISEDDDLFGSTVQLAARIVDKAAEGQVLVSSSVHGLSQGKKLKFERYADLDMKGFDEPVTVYLALWDPDAPKTVKPEPVTAKPLTQGAAPLTQGAKPLTEGAVPLQQVIDKPAPTPQPVTQPVGDTATKVANVGHVDAPQAKPTPVTKQQPAKPEITTAVSPLTSTTAAAPIAPPPVKSAPAKSVLSTTPAVKTPKPQSTPGPKPSPAPVMSKTGPQAPKNDDK